MLQTVTEEQGPSASEISKRLVLDNATMSGVLDRLGDGGWIKRRNNETDRRVNRIFLSAKAAQQGRTLSELRTETNDQVMASLSIEERVILKRLLRDVRCRITLPSKNIRELGMQNATAALAAKAQ